MDLIPGQRWYAAGHGRADLHALAIYKRHYSAKRHGGGLPQRQFVEPGANLVLLTATCDALWVWHYGMVKVFGGQKAVFCAVFRNEGTHRASDLIREAEQLAWRRWPGETLYTWVDPRKVVSEVPGYCFRRAGWRRIGSSKKGLLLFARRPRLEGTR